MVILYYRIIMRLLFLALFLGFYGFSQKISIKYNSNIEQFALDSTNNRILFFYPNYYKILNLKSFKLDSLALYYEKGISLKDFKTIIIKGVPFFISRGSGFVYTLKNDSIKRIDNSYNHKMQYGSQLFVQNDTIFRYGGYGFWSVRDFFIYYDKDHSKEWEIPQYFHPKTIPEGTFYGNHIQTKKAIYFFYGHKVDKYNRLISNIDNNDVWKFNLKEKEWHYLGITNKKLNSENQTSIPYGNKLILLKDKKIVLIDVLKNKFTKYSTTALSNKLINIQSPIFYRHKFYGFLRFNNKTAFGVINEGDFFGVKLTEQYFYYNYTWWIKIFFLVIISPLLLFFGFKKLIIVYKKLGKIVLLENGLKHKNQLIEFDIDSMQILNLLLSEKEVLSNSILKIVEKSQFSPAHNERIKVQKINEINIKVQTLLHINEDVITSIKSANDRRIRIYKIEKKFFFRHKL